MVFINNFQNNIHITQSEQPASSGALPEWHKKIHELIQIHLDQTPPKQLSRVFRNYFFLHAASIKNVNADWEDLVLNMLAIIEMIDEAEDNT